VQTNQRQTKTMIDWKNKIQQSITDKGCKYSLW